MSASSLARVALNICVTLAMKRAEIGLAASPLPEAALATAEPPARA